MISLLIASSTKFGVQLGMRNETEKYSYRVSWCENNQYFIAQCAEFPGVTADGPTAAEALLEAQSLVAAGVAWLIEDGQVPPPPLSGFSGKLLVRLPKELHRELFLQAQQAGVSVNRLVSGKLAR